MDMQVFTHAGFGELRATADSSETWFVAADVCRALGHTNVTVALDRLDDDEKAKLNLGLSGGSTNVVTFPGLLSLVLGSRKPEAREYKRWVTHEVLPSIHRTGGYMVARADETPLETVSRALLIVKEALDRKSEQADRLAEENAAMAPKALFADVVANSEGLILMRDLAHMLRQNGIDIGERRLFQWMRDNGFLEKNRNEPTQKSLDMGLMRVVVGSYVGSDGRNMMTRTAKITGKGQQYFVNRFLAQKEAVA